MPRAAWDDVEVALAQGDRIGAFDLDAGRRRASR